MSCHAIRSSDEMHCARCRLRWDVNDEDPPPCPCGPIPDVASPPLAPTTKKHSPKREPFVSALAPRRF